MYRHIYGKFLGNIANCKFPGGWGRANERRGGVSTWYTGPNEHEIFYSDIASAFLTSPKYYNNPS